MSRFDKESKDFIERDVVSGSLNLYDLDSKSINISELSNSVDILITYSNYNLPLNLSAMNGFINEVNKSNFSGNILLAKIPGGAFELPLLSEYIITQIKPKIAVFLGCIIKGETSHYEFLSSTVINAIRNLSVSSKLPIVNGVLTVESIKQAIDRAGINQNKGKEFAQTSLEILTFLNNFPNGK